MLGQARRDNHGQVTVALARVVRVDPGEGRLAASLFALMFMTALGAGSGLTAADALLFSREGVAALPQLYLALGVVSFVLALGVSVVFGALRRDRVYPIGLAVLTAALLALRLAVADPAGLAYPAMWLGANVVASLQGIVAWGVASWICDARQAKRLFPVANAAKILGAIAGSAAVAPLVLVVRLEDLLVLWAATLAVAVVVVLRLRRGAPAAPPVRRDVALRDELVVGFRVVRASPLLRGLALSLVLFSVLFFALALPFTRAAREAYPREDELAAFLGVFGATTTAAAFLASLFLANRIYARFGVVQPIFVFTLIYLAGFVALTLTDSFLVVVAARWLQLAWLAGIADAAYQALFNPVPAERRDQMRAFMEGVPGQAGIALGGLLLLVGDRALEPRQVAAGGAAVAALSAVVIWRTRGAYREALVAALRTGRPEPFLGARLAYGRLAQDPSAIAVAVAGLSSDDGATRRASAQILGDIAPPSARAALGRAANDADPVVRAAALRGGARLGGAEFVAAARAALDQADVELRAAALLVLHRAADAGAAARLRAMAGDPDPAARHAAMLAIAEADPAAARVIALGLATDPDGAVRAAATDVLVERDPAAALWHAEAALAVPPERDRALAMLEALPAARGSAVLADFAVERRARALRDRALAHSLPTGELAELLALSLRRRAAHAARQAVRAAAVLSGRVAPVALLDGLASDEPGFRAEALETLESYVRPDLVRPLLALWEGAPPSAALSELTRDDDPWIRDCATQLERAGGDDMATLATIPTMERVLFLHKVPLFAALDPADLQQVARVATERAFATGETLFRQGDRGDALYVVVDGALRIEQDGRPVATRGRGEVVGEMSIVSDRPRIATVIGAADGRALSIGRAEFESILRDRPETAIGVIRMLALRLAEATAAR